ncbi:AAA family ATPase [bacterium]|nr:AAA family ATPase [bacterium]
MQVSRLEIFGFKSFMERLVLPLKGGITGVVGPNGCGKSNIVDALRWVLGETNARSLRGGLLEDVIFNGTDSFRPLGLAEVSITIASEGGSLYEDICSSSREGEIQQHLQEADEQIEEVSSKLKALQDLESSESEGEENGAQEVASDSLSSPDGSPKLRVLAGGELRGEEEEPPSEEEGEALPEGVPDADERSDLPGVSSTGGESLSHVSEQLLQQKFGWLKGVSEVQVTRRLYRSGEAEFFLNRTPCRLRDLRDFFRIVGISARTFTIVAQGEVSRIVTAKPEQRRQIFEEAAGVLGLRDKIAASERRLKDTAENVARLEDIEREVERQVNSLKRQANKAKRRESLKEELHTSERGFLLEKLRRVRAQREVLSQEVGELESQEEAITEKPQGASLQEEALRTELLEVELLVEQLRETLDSRKEEANARGRKEESLKGKQHELKMLFEAKGTEGKRITERLQTLVERRDASQSRLEELKSQEGALQEKLQELESMNDDTLQRLDTELRELRQKVREQEHHAQGIRDTLRKVEGELTATQKQMREQARQGIYEHRKSDELKRVFERAEGQLPQVLAELFEVEPRYTKAIQAALGDRISYFVVSHAAEIAAELEQVASHTAGSSEKDEPGFWYGLLQRVAPGSSVSESTAASEALSGAVAAREIVRADEPVRVLLENLLRSVFVVPNLEDGLELFRQGVISPEMLVVTEQGERITGDEVASPQMERGLLDIQQDITQLGKERSRLQGEFEEISGRIAGLSTEVTAKEAEHGEALRKKQEQEQAVRELSRELGSLRGYVSAETQSISQVEHDIARSEEHERELHRRVEELEERKNAVEQELEVFLAEDSSDLHREVRELAEQLGAKDSERRSLRERFEEARQLADSERRTLEDLRRKLSTKQLERERVTVEEEHVVEAIAERIPLQYLEPHGAESQEAQSQEAGDGTALRPEQLQLDDLPEPLSEEEFRRLEEVVAKVRAQLLREGEVDPSSIARYEEESERLAELTAQREDLEAASATLKKTVKLLREQSVNRFVATFEQVREHFVTLMPRLFGGGSADIELVNTEDPLESGIDVTVRPPGKKPKSLDLLSGGEKAMCATALIVSLFLVRPSPLCVLDEVDAPLDEANLVRFLSLVKEMSEHTQFLVITHNKASMTAADRLIGVTMQKPGSSSVLTVSLDEAYSHVA